MTNARYLELIAGGRDPARWAQAGDQLYVDYDISHTNLPVGSRFAVGEVVLEVSPDPHHGCGKYMKRFGVQAMKFANTEEGRELRLRGLHARVIEPGVVRRGDRIVEAARAARLVPANPASRASGSSRCLRASRPAGRRGSSAATRVCSSESRSRRVTVPSSIVWPSTVIPHGVPISSWRR